VSRPEPDALAMDARQDAWSRLWQRLLAQPPDTAPPETEPNEIKEESEDAV
jgi:hypothetical protein